MGFTVLYDCGLDASPWMCGLPYGAGAPAKETRTKKGQYLKGHGML